MSTCCTFKEEIYLNHMSRVVEVWCAANIKLKVAKDSIGNLMTFLGYIEQCAGITKEMYLFISGELVCDRCYIFTFFLLSLCILYHFQNLVLGQLRMGSLIFFE